VNNDGPFGSIGGSGGAPGGGSGRGTPETVFPIYSITKTLTAICILRLAELGSLRLDSSSGPRADDIEEALLASLFDRAP
jgi:beta-lactamase family protein